MSKAAPYLAVDFDVLERVGPCGRACGLTREQLFMGLGDLWQFCWREKTEHVTTTHILGFFYGVNACEALLAFKFIAASPEGWRVKGADRWLFVQKTRSDNGKANAGNLRRGTSPGSPPAAPRQPPGSTGESTPAVPGKLPALTASSVKRPTTNEEASSVAEAPAKPKPPVVETLPPQKHPKPPKQPPNPRHTPLVQALTDAYREETLGAAYDFTGFDAVNVTRLLAKSADNEEIVFRWRTAIRLSLDKFHKPKVHTLGELCTHWNAYPTPPKDAHRTTEMRL